MTRNFNVWEEIHATLHAHREKPTGWSLVARCLVTFATHLHLYDFARMREDSPLEWYPWGYCIWLVLVDQYKHKHQVMPLRTISNLVYLFESAPMLPMKHALNAQRLRMLNDLTMLHIEDFPLHEHNLKVINEQLAPYLRRLELIACDLQDPYMVHLNKLSRLEDLNLSRNMLSVNALDVLTKPIKFQCGRSLKALRTVYISLRIPNETVIQSVADRVILKSHKDLKNQVIGEKLSTMKFNDGRFLLQALRWFPQLDRCLLDLECLDAHWDAFKRLAIHMQFDIVQFQGVGRLTIPKVWSPLKQHVLLCGMRPSLPVPSRMVLSTTKRFIQLIPLEKKSAPSVKLEQATHNFNEDSH